MSEVRELNCVDVLGDLLSIFSSDPSGEHALLDLLSFFGDEDALGFSGGCSNAKSADLGEIPLLGELDRVDVLGDLLSIFSSAIIFFFDGCSAPKSADLGEHALLDLLFTFGDGDTLGFFDGCSATKSADLGEIPKIGELDRADVLGDLLRIFSSAVVGARGLPFSAAEGELEGSLGDLLLKLFESAIAEKETFKTLACKIGTNENMMGFRVLVENLKKRM